MIVDFHTHTFPQKIAAAALEKLKHASRTVPLCSGMDEGLRSSMNTAGIDRSVVLPVATNPYKTQSINDLSMRMMDDAQLIYFGAIHPDTPDASRELARIAQAGIRGIKLHPVYQGVDFNDKRTLRILETAGELGLIVLTHAGEDIGYPGIVRVSPEMIADALGQVGPVQLVLAHMGGWRDWARVADCLADTSVLLDTAFSLGALTPLTEQDHPGEKRQMLDSESFCGLVRAFGADRVLFGTDSPWADQRAYLEQIRALPLMDGEKEAILGGNACRVLGIG